MNAIQNATNLDEIVSIINRAETQGVPYPGGTDLRAPEEMAAEYTADSVLDESFDLVESIKYNLEFLSDAGAKFDYQVALHLAMTKYLLIVANNQIDPDRTESALVAEWVNAPTDEISIDVNNGISVGERWLNNDELIDFFDWLAVQSD